MHDSKQDFRGSRSIWADSEEDSPYSAIPDDAMTDVCIVGAGIAGITTAYLLAREGLSVIEQAHRSTRPPSKPVWFS